MSELVKDGFHDPKDMATTRVHSMRRDSEMSAEDEEAQINKDRE